MYEITVCDEDIYFLNQFEKFHEKSFPLKIEKILYIESRNRQMIIRMEEESIQIHYKISKIERLLEEHGFFRIHKEYLVNGERISRVKKKGIVMEHEIYLPVSRSKRKGVKEQLMENLFGEEIKENPVAAVVPLSKQEDDSLKGRYMSEVQMENRAQLYHTYSKSKTIDSVLLQKEMEAKNMGIPMEIQTKVPPEIPVRESDLCALLFRFTDHAMERAKNVRDTWIKIQVFVKKSYLCIHMANKTDHMIENLYGKTKREKKYWEAERKMMDSLVEKYDGILKYKAEEAVFHMYAAFPLIPKW